MLQMDWISFMACFTKIWPCRSSTSVRLARVVVSRPWRAGASRAIALSVQRVSLQFSSCGVSDIVFWTVLASSTTPVNAFNLIAHGPINAIVIVVEVIISAVPSCWANMITSA